MGGQCFVWIESAVFRYKADPVNPERFYGPGFLGRHMTLDPDKGFFCRQLLIDGALFYSQGFGQALGRFPGIFNLLRKCSDGGNIDAQRHGISFGIIDRAPLSVGDV